MAAQDRGSFSVGVAIAVICFAVLLVVVALLALAVWNHRHRLPQNGRFPLVSLPPPSRPVAHTEPDTSNPGHSQPGTQPRTPAPRTPPQQTLRDAFVGAPDDAATSQQAEQRDERDPAAHRQQPPPTNALSRLMQPTYGSLRNTSTLSHPMSRQLEQQLLIERQNIGMSPRSGTRLIMRNSQERLYEDDDDHFIPFPVPEPNRPIAPLPPVLLEQLRRGSPAVPIPARNPNRPASPSGTYLRQAAEDLAARNPNIGSLRTNSPGMPAAQRYAHTRQASIPASGSPRHSGRARSATPPGLDSIREEGMNGDMARDSLERDFRYGPPQLDGNDERDYVPPSTSERSRRYAFSHLSGPPVSGFLIPTEAQSQSLRDLIVPDPDHVIDSPARAGTRAQPMIIDSDDEDDSPARQLSRGRQTHRGADRANEPVASMPYADGTTHIWQLTGGHGFQLPYIEMPPAEPGLFGADSVVHGAGGQADDQHTPLILWPSYHPELQMSIAMWQHAARTGQINTTLSGEDKVAVCRQRATVSSRARRAENQSRLTENSHDDASASDSHSHGGGDVARDEVAGEGGSLGGEVAERKRKRSDGGGEEGD